MSVETLHFKIGEDLGIRLMEISQEHLLYDADVDKALNVFNESFGGGCPIELQYDLLVGSKVVTVDVEEQTFLIVDRDEIHNKVYPPMINFKQFFAEKQKQIEKHCKDFKIGVAELLKDFRGDTYLMKFQTKSIIDFIHGKDEDLIRELETDLSDGKSFISLINDFIGKSIKFSQLAKKLKNHYPDIEFDIFKVIELSKSMIAIRDLDFSSFEDEEDNSVDMYINAITKNSEIIEKGIEPVDIMNNYSAGWLSPKGEYYALNGEIANMLHNEIADALQAKGIIPDKDKRGWELNNPDSWLEQQGWVKIHGNNVQFGGCLNHKIGLDNVHMTDIQKKMIYEYCSILHGGVVRAGWRLTPVSAIRFKETDDMMLAKNYFNFD